MGKQFLNRAPRRLIVLHNKQTDEAVLNTPTGFASWAECGSGLRRDPLPAALPVTCVVAVLLECMCSLFKRVRVVHNIPARM